MRPAPLPPPRRRSPGLPLAVLAFVLGLSAYAGCGRTEPDWPVEKPRDAGHPDAGPDAGPPDAGPPDAGVPCPPGLTRCGADCVDLKTDREHCGGCDQRCVGNSCLFCSLGYCTGVSGYFVCGSPGACTNTGNDPANCRSCGHTCARGQVCDLDPSLGYLGNCLPQCFPGHTSCNGSCVDLQTDARNCGACGRTCPACTVCAGGQCSADAGVLLCTDRCESLNQWPSSGYCTACSTNCSPGLACQRCRFQ